MKFSKKPERRCWTWKSWLMKLKRGVGGLKCVLGEFHILISSETDKSCIYNPHIPDSLHWQGVWILILRPIRHNWKMKCFFTQIWCLWKILSSQKTQNKVKLIHHLCPQSTSGTKNPNLLRLGNFFEMVEMWKSTILSNRCLSHSNLSPSFFLLFIIILYSKDEKCHKNLS